MLEESSLSTHYVFVKVQSAQNKMAAIAFFMACREEMSTEHTLLLNPVGSSHIEPNTDFCHILNIKSNNKYGISKVNSSKIFFLFTFTYFFWTEIKYPTYNQSFFFAEQQIYFSFTEKTCLAQRYVM